MIFYKTTLKTRVNDLLQNYTRNEWATFSCSSASLKLSSWAGGVYKTTLETSINLEPIHFQIPLRYLRWQYIQT